VKLVGVLAGGGEEAAGAASTVLLRLQERVEEDGDDGAVSFP
jgi:hypothetical protein